jgi:hypothetical protein
MTGSGSTVLIRCLDGSRDGRRGPRVRPPELELHLNVRFRAEPMRLALVAGVRPAHDARHLMLIARDGAVATVLERARLYPFTRLGWDAAVADANRLMARLDCGRHGWITFVWRVLVEGPWKRPRAVTPVWVLEGHERPVYVKYYFQ